MKQTHDFVLLGENLGVLLFFVCFCFLFGDRFAAGASSSARQERQMKCIELIASENFTSRAVMECGEPVVAVGKGSE